jgi:hypothetical protein
MSGPKQRRANRESGGAEPSARAHDHDPEAKPRGMERLGDLLPGAVREFGLEDQLEQAQAASAWLDIVAELVPAAAHACRLIDLRQGVATVETDEPIVSQEIRLRSPELLSALRARPLPPIRQLRVTTRHV